MLIKGWLVLLFSAVWFSYFSCLAVSGSFLQKEEQKKVEKRPVCNFLPFRVESLRESNTSAYTFFEELGRIPQLKTRWGVLPFEVCMKVNFHTILNRSVRWSIHLSLMSGTAAAASTITSGAEWSGNVAFWGRCFLLTPCMIYKALGDIGDLSEADMEKMTIFIAGNVADQSAPPKFFEPRPVSRSTFKVMFRDVPFLTRTKSLLHAPWVNLTGTPLGNYGISGTDAEIFKPTRLRIVEYKDGSLPTCDFEPGLESTGTPDSKLVSGKTEFLIFNSDFFYDSADNSRCIQPMCPPPEWRCPLFSQASKLDGKEVSEVENAY